MYVSKLVSKVLFSQKSTPEYLQGFQDQIIHLLDMKRGVLYAGAQYLHNLWL